MAGVMLAVFVSVVEVYRSDKVDALKSAPVRLAHSALPVADLVIFGDSRAADFGEAYNSTVSSSTGVATASSGLGGDVTNNMRLRLTEDILAKRPKFVVLMAGINDLIAGALQPDKQRAAVVANAVANLSEIINRLLDEDVKVYFLTIGCPMDQDYLYQFVYGSEICSDVQTVNKYIYDKFESKIHIEDVVVLFRDGGVLYDKSYGLDALHYSDIANYYIYLSVTYFLLAERE